MAYFLRRDEAGQPVEHQNLRRPVSRALPDIFDLLSRRADLANRIEPLLQRLADDPDIHVRRALSDALDRLALINPDQAVNVLEILIEDQDPYVRQRAWRVLLQLAELSPERAAGYYGRILTA
jgi:HEAT repeat protein